MIEVVVVGSVNADLAASVERIPGPGETVLATGLVRSPGGKGGNQAVAAARAGGVRTEFVGAVGTDGDADWLLARLDAAGVGVSGVARVAGPSGTALIAVDAAGENSIVVVAGANGELTRLSDEQAALVSGARVVLAQLEIPLPTVLATAELTRSAGGVFVLNAAPATPLPSELLDLTDVLVVNEHEALIVAGVSDLDEAMDALAARTAAVVLTLGARGSRVVRRGHPPLTVRAMPVTAVDTTAAGDTYCGCLAAGLARGAEWADVVAEATAAAALAVTRPGAQDSIPERADVLARSAADPAAVAP